MSDKTTSVVAREADGTIQISLTIPWEEVKSAREKALAELAKETVIPGFRKGKAPLAKVEAAVAKETLVRKTLAEILPQAIGAAITEHKIKPAIYPRLEVVSADADKPWQVRAVTCELPVVELGNYKETIKAAAKPKTIWTPDKGKEARNEPTREEKQQEVIKILLEAFKVNIPKVLIEEEVNNRLSSLLERIEKLGLSLDSYLTSIGKTPETIREDYRKQAEETITLDLILNKIAEEEKVKVEEAQIDEVVKASPSFNTPEQRRIVASVLRRRASLDSLAALI
jgi:FKBP-type peptidyl-prolyl cis-trans isomerase (trigger factor)